MTRKNQKPQKPNGSQLGWPTGECCCGVPIVDVGHAGLSCYYIRQDETGGIILYGSQQVDVVFSKKDFHNAGWGKYLKPYPSRTWYYRLLQQMEQSKKGYPFFVVPQTKKDKIEYCIYFEGKLIDSYQKNDGEEVWPASAVSNFNANIFDTNYGVVGVGGSPNSNGESIIPSFYKVWYKNIFLGNFTAFCVSGDESIMWAIRKDNGNAVCFKNGTIVFDENIGVVFGINNYESPRLRNCENFFFHYNEYSNKITAFAYRDTFVKTDLHWLGGFVSDTSDFYTIVSRTNSDTIIIYYKGRIIAEDRYDCGMKRISGKCVLLRYKVFYEGELIHDAEERAKEYSLTVTGQDSVVSICSAYRLFLQTNALLYYNGTLVEEKHGKIEIIKVDKNEHLVGDGYSCDVYVGDIGIIRRENYFIGGSTMYSTMYYKDSQTKEWDKDVSVQYASFSYTIINYTDGNSKTYILFYKGQQVKEWNDPTNSWIQQLKVSCENIDIEYLVVEFGESLFKFWQGNEVENEFSGCPEKVGKYFIGLGDKSYIYYESLAVPPVFESIYASSRFSNYDGEYLLCTTDLLLYKGEIVFQITDSQYITGAPSGCFDTNRIIVPFVVSDYTDRETSSKTMKAWVEVHEGGSRVEMGESGNLYAPWDYTTDRWKVSDTCSSIIILQKYEDNKVVVYDTTFGLMKFDSNFRRVA